MSRLQRNAQAGVTLLELMISLWVMAAAALILSSSLGLIGRMLNRVVTEGEDTDYLIDRLTLRRWIEAVPPGATFAGGPDQLSFTTLVDATPLTVAGPALVRLTQDETGVHATLQDATVADAQVVQKLMLSPENQLVIGYNGSETFGAQPAWHDTWPLTADVPRLIRISYDIGDRTMPPLTVIPALWDAQSEMSLSSPVPPG